MTDYAVVPISPFSGKAEVHEMIGCEDHAIEGGVDVYAIAAIASTSRPVYLVEKRDRHGFVSLGYASAIMPAEDKP